MTAKPTFSVDLRIIDYKEAASTEVVQPEHFYGS
jgi:hypothetical protein